MRKEGDEQVLEEYANRAKVLKLHSESIAPLLKDEARLERANRSLFQTLYRHLEIPAEPLPEFPTTVEQVAIANVFATFAALASMQQSLGQVEYYFRRFPFSDLPVSHADHLRNVCEMYFDRIEQFRQRLKALTVALKEYSGKADNRYGMLVKRFSSHFVWEQKQRNLTHHHRRFEYDAIDQLGLIELLRLSPQYGHLPDTSIIYRHEARKWVSRVRAHSKQLGQVVEIAAGFVLEMFPDQVAK